MKIVKDSGTVSVYEVHVGFTHYTDSFKITTDLKPEVVYMAYQYFYKIDFGALRFEVEDEGN